MYLEWHDLTELPNSVTQLTDLTILRLSNNDLESLPDNIFNNLTNLKTLDLGYNELISIPISISNMINLDFLWLRPK